MSSYYFLIPISVLLGVTGLGAFLWSLRHRQYEDMTGAATRILLDDGDRPIADRKAPGAE